MTLIFAGWRIRDQQPTIAQRIDAASFWHRHSVERLELLEAQEQARMDEVHESRASRRLEREAELSRLDRLDGLALPDYTDGLIDPEFCEHPKAKRYMRGWTEVCRACGQGRAL